MVTGLLVEGEALNTALCRTLTIAALGSAIAKAKQGNSHALTVAEGRMAGVAGLAMPVRLVIAAEGYGDLADLVAV
jgi:hypothetical protein